MVCSFSPQSREWVSVLDMQPVHTNLKFVVAAFIFSL
ncbi:hypothetical protein AmaxDRAFT_1763 [Limnospira maxima CS-328]|uniref:Uncharacterized protein n=1 Tax=Limnospira maxima CS-328 TaxID=513049 RepID=B5VZ25_LIMMA|nr:hypothetical protein AmaxDRAFT_1763 [Limnospira maxima CS-328]